MYAKMSVIFIFSLFSGFYDDFIIYINFTMSQLQTQQLMTSQIRSHRIFNTHLKYSYVSFVIKIDEKSIRFDEDS